MDISKLENKIKSYNPECDFELLERCYLFALEAHENQSRYSGEPYIYHPLEVAYILADLQIDIKAICAGLLHDVIEDTFVTYEVVNLNFGKDIADMVDGVTKIGKLHFADKKQRQSESLRKMIIAMASDVRVILIKLADRLHNMRTLEAMKIEKQKEKALETLEIYAPIAHRLGISKIKWELEDLSLRYLDEEAYYDIGRKISLKRQEREKYINEIIEKLKEKLSSANISAKIEGRPKHFYSIYKKMKNGKDFEEIYDLFGIRILVDNVNDCYGVLGLSHTLWNPIPKRFKDYIATPKANMYQSLHTTVFSKGFEPFEIQIRTYEMHRTSEYGIAAHWRYKEGKKEDDSFEKKLTWIRELMEFDSDVKNTEEFLDIVKVDLFSDEVFVFTPNGKVIQLPSGACPIDFAYRIHSDIGNKCIGAKVNGKMVPLTHKLTNGNIVEVVTSSASKGPSRDWLNVVVSSHAKNKIRNFFKKLDRDENISRGKDLFEKEVKKIGHTISEMTKPNHIEFIKKRFNVSSLDDLYAAIGYGGIKYGFVVQRIKEHFKEEFQEEDKKDNEVKLTKYTKKQNSNAINVQGYNDLAVVFSKCCNPVYGDKIVGYITVGRGIAIHRSDCLNINNNLDEKRFINVSWNNTNNDKDFFSTNLKIIASDRPNLVSEISSLIGNEGIQMTSFAAELDKENKCIVNITINVNNLDQVTSLIKKLMSIRDIKKAYRI